MGGLSYRGMFAWRPLFVPRGLLPLVGFALHASFLYLLGLIFCGLGSKFVHVGEFGQCVVSVALVGFTAIRACARRGVIVVFHDF